MKSKFSILRSIRRKEFNAENYITKPFTFYGRQKSVYENANLSIFVNESCNADCRFCVDQIRGGVIYASPSQPVNIHHWWGAN